MVDVEALLIPAMTSALGARVVTDTPANLLEVLTGSEGTPGVGVVQVVRIGGPSDDNNPRFDMPTVSIDSYGLTRAAALELASGVDDFIRITIPRQIIADTTIMRTQTVSGPSWRPNDNTALRRVGASYRLYLKSRS